MPEHTPLRAQATQIRQIRRMPQRSTAAPRESAPPHRHTPPERQQAHAHSRWRIPVSAQIRQMLQLQTAMSPDCQLHSRTHRLWIALKVPVPAAHKALPVRCQIQPATQIADFQLGHRNCDLTLLLSLSLCLSGHSWPPPCWHFPGPACPVSRNRNRRAPSGAPTSINARFPRKVARFPLRSPTDFIAPSRPPPRPRPLQPATTADCSSPAHPEACASARTLW